MRRLDSAWILRPSVGAASNEGLRRAGSLREDQLQLAARLQPEIRVALRADADPVDSRRRLQRAIGLDGNLEALRMDGSDELPIELQKRFTSGEDDKSSGGVIAPFP